MMEVTTLVDRVEGLAQEGWFGLFIALASGSRIFHAFAVGQLELIRIQRRAGLEADHRSAPVGKGHWLGELADNPMLIAFFFVLEVLDLRGLRGVGDHFLDVNEIGLAPGPGAKNSDSERNAQGDD